MLLHAKSRKNTAEIASETSGYFRHFGLRQDPFGSEGKENSFYLLPDWEQHIDLILHYLRHENVLLTLTGSKGTGKTTLINFFLLEAIHGFSPTETAAKSKLCAGELLVQLGDTTRTCQVIADNALDPEQILEVIASAFDVSTDHLVGPFEEQAEAVLNHLQHSKQRCVLLIDQAQELPDATLSLLLYMINQQSDVQHQFHVTLIGGSELKKRFTKLCKAKDYHNLVHSIELGPLNLAQTEYYLKHRLTAAGLQDKIPFANGSIQKIYKLSGGVPKTINQLARQLLIENLKKNRFSSLGAVFKPYKKTLVGGSFLLASFAIILFYLGQDTKTNKTITQERYPAQSVVAESKSVQPTNSQNIASLSQPTPPLPLTNTATPRTDIPLQPLPQPQTSEPTTQRLSPDTATPPSEPLSSPEKSDAPANLAASPTPQSDIPSQPESVIVATSSLIEPSSVQTSNNTTTQTPFLLPKKQSDIQLPQDLGSIKPPKHTPSIPKNIPNLPIKSLKKTSDKIVTELESESSELAEINKNSKHTSLKGQKINNESRSTTHFMQLNPNHYTLKLTELPTESSVKMLLAKYKLGKNLMYYQTAHQYILVYGEYADTGTAKHAIELLPTKLKSLAPKPYRIGSLQQTAR